MMKMLTVFCQGSDGAVTVDWVVLTAAIVGLGIAVANSVRLGAHELAKNTATALQANVVDLGPLGYSD